MIHMIYKYRRKNAYLQIYCDDFSTKVSRLQIYFEIFELQILFWSTRKKDSMTKKNMPLIIHK